MESQTQTHTHKRGGSKASPLHLGMLVVSMLLLTIAGIFLVMEYNTLGIVTMVAGIAVRVADSRL